jgi:diketogulonate reductase-like aldo/keto reductase
MGSDAVTADGRALVLDDGNPMPMLGLGVWQVPNGPECVSAVRWALELGYRHIDTAQAYGNEESVGRALHDSGVPREEVFITTKFYPAHRDPAAEAENSLRRIGVDQVDLYIIHWPRGGPIWAWPGMERARELGYARSIGVSNFSAGELEEVSAAASVAPAVNQVQFSPFEYRRALLEACRRRGIALEAYSPLGTGRHLSNERVIRIAQRAGRTPAQVLLRWCLQHELPLNGRIFEFTLSEQDMSELDALDETGGTDRALERKWW